MKYFVIFVALLPLVWGQNKPSTIGGQLREAIESLRDRMPCGFPEYGIPPMAPFKTAHQEIAIDTRGIQTYGEVNEFRLDGLNDFDIVYLKVQALLSRITFKFNWNNVHLETYYNVSTARDSKGLRRYGPAKFALQDFTVWGVIKYTLGLLGGKLAVKDLSVYVSLGGVNSEIGGLSDIKIINKKLNRVIEEWFMLAVNDNTNRVAEITNSEVKPLVNYFLSDKSLSDLLAMAGSGGESGGKEPCMPPQDLQ